MILSRLPKNICTSLLLLSVLLLLVMSNISIALSQLSLALGLLFLLIGKFSGQFQPGRIGLEKPALFLAIWALVMIPFSGDPGQSMVFYRRFYLFSALWVVATAIDSEDRRRHLLTALIVGSVAISLFGQITVFLETGSLFQTRLGGMSNPMTSGCLLMMSLLAIVGFLAAGGMSKRWQLVLMVVSLPVAVGLLQTLTRSAFLGMLAGGLLILILVRPRLTGILLILVVGFLLLIPHLPETVVSPAVAERFSINSLASSRSGGERMEMWQGGWQMVKQNPLTGLGDRDLTQVSAQYYGDDESEYYGHLHSNPVMLAVIWGVPGFLLASYFLGLQAWLLWKRWRSPQLKSRPWLRGWVLSGLGVWVGFMVAGLTEWYFGDAESMLLYFAIMGVALSDNGELNV